MCIFCLSISIVVLFSGGIWIADNFNLINWGALSQYGPLITATVGLIGACVAIIAIRTQRDIARKRAAIDFFLKTEMDQNLWEAYAAFKSGCVALGALSPEADIELFVSGAKTRNHYSAIRRYLNLHELIAVGVNNNVFDDRVCYEYWCTTLSGDYKSAERIIEYARVGDGGGPKTYADLSCLNKKWTERS